MAERYATQRSRKDSRRRSLPRLSDVVPTAVQERGFDEGQETPADAGGVVVEDLSGPVDAVERHLPRRATARRTLPVGRRGRAVPAPTITHVDYSYVKLDLRRIAITAIAMLALLVVLNI